MQVALSTVAVLIAATDAIIAGQRERKVVLRAIPNNDKGSNSLASRSKGDEDVALTIDDLLKRSEQALENADTLRAVWKEIWKAAKEANPYFTTPEEAQAGQAINIAIGIQLQESLACSQLAQTRILFNVSSLGDTEDTIRFYDSYAWELRNLR